MSVSVSRFPQFVPLADPMCLHLDCFDSLNSRNCIFESFWSKFYLFERFCLEFDEISHCSNALKNEIFHKFSNFYIDNHVWTVLKRVGHGVEHLQSHEFVAKWTLFQALNWVDFALNFLKHAHFCRFSSFTCMYVSNEVLRLYLSWPKFGSIPSKRARFASWSGPSKRRTLHFESFVWFSNTQFAQTNR